MRRSNLNRSRVLRRARILSAVVGGGFVLLVGCAGVDGEGSGTGLRSGDETATTPQASSAPTPVPVATVTVRPERIPVGSGPPRGIASGADGTLWVSMGRATHQVDPATGEILDTLPGTGPHAFTVVDGEIWASDFDADEVRVTDAATGTRPASVRGARPEGVLFAHDAIWVALHNDGAVARIDPVSREVVETIGLHDATCCGPQGLEADDR